MRVHTCLAGFSVSISCLHTRVHADYHLTGFVPHFLFCRCAVAYAYLEGLANNPDPNLRVPLHCWARSAQLQKLNQVILHNHVNPDSKVPLNRMYSTTTNNAAEHKMKNNKEARLQGAPEAFYWFMKQASQYCMKCKHLVLDQKPESILMPSATDRWSDGEKSAKELHCEITSYTNDEWWVWNPAEGQSFGHRVNFILGTCTCGKFQVIFCWSLDFMCGSIVPEREQCASVPGLCLCVYPARPAGTSCVLSCDIFCCCFRTMSLLVHML